MMLDVCVVRVEGVLGARFIRGVLTTSLESSSDDDVDHAVHFWTSQVAMTTFRHGHPTGSQFQASNREQPSMHHGPAPHRPYHGPAGSLAVNDSMYSQSYCLRNHNAPPMASTGRILMTSPSPAHSGGMVNLTTAPEASRIAKTK